MATDRLNRDPVYDLPTHPPAARRLHWTVALLLAVQIPVGLYMIYRSEDMMGVDEKGQPVKGVWDGVTDFLFSSHKTVGIVIFALVLLRLIYRVTRGVPPPDPTVPRGLIGASHGVHWLLYLMLILVPISGYLGISYGRYLDVFGVHLPALTEKSKDMSEAIFEWHETGAWIIVGLVTLHVLAAIYHRFVRRDRVVERMIPKRVA